MFVYRGLLLAVTISTSIVLADTRVQPGYEHQYNTDPQYQTFGVRDTTSQQFHDTYYGASPSNLQLVSYPHHYYHHPYYHRYQHPSTYYHRTSIHHPQQAPSHYYTVTAHHRYKRSPDSANTESNKTTIALRDAVPAISTLDSPLMTTIMPPHYRKKIMDAINNKLVENSPSQNNHPFKLTGLLGLNPENMLSGNRQIKSQQHESDEKQYLKQYLFPISSSENNKLRQRKHHNEAIFHTHSVTDDSSKPTVGTVSTTKVCFNNTQRKNNITLSFALPSSNGLFYSLSLPVDVTQQTTDNQNSNMIDGNNILYYINTGTSSYLIPETYKSQNFRPFQEVSNYYSVSPRNIAPQRYTPSYVIPMTYTSSNTRSVKQIPTYNYPVSPRCIAPRTYYSIYPSAYNNVPYVYQTFSSPAYY